ncbi:hypothetical protein K0B04_02480 [Patescibacteria group bacterium]|nr:hypothetical protein [Patescibacteria group bacterium]
MIFNAQEYQKNKQKGQTLVIVIVVMVLALSVGVTISSRYIKTLRDLSESDNSSRALAVAEAAIENILMVPDETLKEYIDTGICDTCTLEISGENNYRARADVELSYAGLSDDLYIIKVNEGEVYQLNLNGYNTGSTVGVCWDSMSPVYASYIYEQSGVFSSEIYAYNPIGYSGTTNGYLEAESLYGYQNCFTVNIVDTPHVLRVKPNSGETFFYFIPTDGQDIPSQGILITSVGRSGNAIRKVQVLKTTGSVPEFFDYVIYQKSLDDPLSNRPN